MRTFPSASLRAVAVVVGVLALACAAAVPAQAAPPDGRAYELVSPTDKTDRDILPFIRPSASGDAVAFQSFGKFAGSAAPAGNQNTYLARRAAGGWTTEPLSPAAPVSPPSQFGSLRDFPFVMFRDDLSLALFGNYSSDLVPGEPTKSHNLYLRDTRTGANTLLTPLPGIDWSGAVTETYVERPNIAWASSNLQHVVFDTPHGQAINNLGAIYFPGSPWGRTTGDFMGVYHWSAQDGLSIASVLPDGTIAETAEAGSGPLISAYKEDANFTDEYGGQKRAVSEDGTRIFFTSRGDGSARPSGDLYVRKDHGTPEAETVRVSAPEQDVPEPDRAAWFRGASRDGSKVLFTSCAPLTLESTVSQAEFDYDCSPTTPPDPPADNALYLFDVEANEGAGDLVDLTANVAGGPRVLGLVGMSDDLSRIYVAAAGVLAPGGVDGEPSLYLWEEGNGFSHITELSKGYSTNQPDVTDATNWLPEGHKLKDSRVSSNGRYLVFTSHATIDPDYDNTDPDTLHPLKQVYHWEIGDPEPTCVSCGGDLPTTSSLSNQRIGENLLLLPVYPDWEKRNLLPDGRVFFETANELVAEDTNEEIDVYVYDPLTDAVTLMSGGKSGRPSNFAGATADGSDVFIRTGEQLVEWDTDASMDVYDVRVTEGGSIVTPPPPPPPCPFSSCAPPPTLGTGGPGNAEPGPTGRFTVAAIGSAQVRRFAKTGKLTLRTNVPSAGTVTAVARAKLGKRSAIVARASKQATQAGAAALTLRLSKKARKTLARKRRLTVQIQVAFGSERRTVSLKLKRAKG